MGGIDMSVLYTHCAHCGFPAVVSVVERSVPRRCRQCGERYIPEPPGDDGSVAAGPRMYFTTAERREKLRTRIRRTRRNAV